MLADSLVPFGPASSERSAERIALMLGAGPSPEADTEIEPRPVTPKRESGADRRASSKPGAGGSPLEAAPTLKVASGEPSVAPAVASVSSRKKTAVVWGLGGVGIASLVAAAGSFVGSGPSQRATAAPSVVAPPDPTPTLTIAAAPRLVEIAPAPAKSASELPSAAPPATSVAPRPAAKEATKSPKAASPAPAPSASAVPPKQPAPDPSALDPLSRLKPL
jgi:hypothetical protein